MVLALRDAPFLLFLLKLNCLAKPGVPERSIICLALAMPQACMAKNKVVYDELLDEMRDISEEVDEKQSSANNDQAPSQEPAT